MFAQVNLFTWIYHIGLRHSFKWNQPPLCGWVHTYGTHTSFRVLTSESGQVILVSCSSDPTIEEGFEVVPEHFFWLRAYHSLNEVTAIYSNHVCSQEACDNVIVEVERTITSQIDNSNALLAAVPMDPMEGETKFHLEVPLQPWQPAGWHAQG